MTVGFVSLLRSVAARRGLDYDAGQVSDAEAAAVAEALTECVRFAYDFYPWPWTCYQVNTAAMTGWNAWDRLLTVWTEEPMAARAAGRVPRQADFITGAGDTVTLLVDGTAYDNDVTPSGVDLWYLFQKAPLRYSAAAYASGTSYATGDVVFYGASCWRALDSGTGAELGVPASGGNWQEQLLPVELEQTVLAGVQRWFSTTDGAPIAARALQSAMQDRLEDAMRALIQMQGQYRGGSPAHRA